MLLLTCRVKGEFIRCGTFHNRWDNFEKLSVDALTRFSSNAEESGLPYEKVEGRNEFIVTII